MSRKEKINEAKAIYDNELSIILKDLERWKEFLTFSSEFYKYSFAENLLMFAQNPNVTMCATMEQWNSVGRWVNRGTKGIRLIDNRDNEISLKYVFDVKDTHGDAKVLFRRWSADNEVIVNILKEYLKYDSINSFEEIIDKYIYDNFDNNSTVMGLSDEQIELLTSEVISNVTKFATYVIAKRANIEVDEENLFKDYGKITSNCAPSKG